MNVKTKLALINALKKVPGLRTAYCWARLRHYRRLQRRNFGRTDGERELSQDRTAWERNLGEEFIGWEGFFKDIDFSERFREDFLWSREHAQVYKKFLARGRNSIKAIDVGCGPVSTLGRRYKGLIIERTLCDPLAEQYVNLLRRQGVSEELFPVACAGEDLSGQFTPGSYDLVHMHNALDHSLEPLKVVQEMAALVAPGGAIYLEHFENEAERENFVNLHKWNLFERDGDMMIANRTEEHSLRGILGPGFQMQAKPVYRNGGVVVAVAWKD